MTAAERFVKRMLVGDTGEEKTDETFKTAEVLPHGDASESVSIMEQGDKKWMESALDAAIEYLQNPANDNVKPNVFSKKWAVKKKPEEGKVKGKKASKTAQDSLYEALVADESPKGKTLAEHDKERHPDGFNPETDSCKFRERLATETEEDKADELDAGKGDGADKPSQVSGKKPSVTAEEDAAYMDAVNRGDMETAARMVREVAARAFPNTKVIGKDGLPKIVYHGGNFRKYETVPDLTPGEMHFGTLEAAKERVAYKYQGMEDSVSIDGYFLNLENPKRMEDIGGDAIWLDYGNPEDRKHDGVVYKNDSEDKGEDSYAISWEPSRIKSADPVTYDDSGKVVPLSRRFDSGDDIRGDVSGSTSSGSDGEEFGESFYAEVYPDRRQSYSSEFGTDEAEENKKAEEAYKANFTKDGKYKSPFEGGKFNRAFLERAREGKGAETVEVWDDESRAAAEAAGRVLNGMLGGVTFELSDKPYGGSNGDSRKSISGIFTGGKADYDKPSLQAIGTGEGSQVYGWGLYGSSERGVGEMYANLVGSDYEHRPTWAINDSSIAPNKIAYILSYFRDDEDSVEDAKKRFAEHIAEKRAEHKDSLADSLEQMMPYFDKAERKEGYLEERTPYLYEQTFFTDREPGDESHLLKWYEDSSDVFIGSRKMTALRDFLRYGDIEEQNKKKLRDVVQRLDSYQPVKGEEIYSAVAYAFGNGIEPDAPKKASEWFAAHDIDGVKYPVDSYGGKSIKNGDDVGWNYVSFRDDNIKVDHKWVDGEQRFFRNSAGKVVGEYNRATNKITLYPGAKIKDVVHEYSHGLWQFAEQEAKAGRDGLQKKLHQIAHAAPEKVKEAVGRSYYDQDPNVVLEECFTHEMARRSEKNKAFAEAIKTASGKEWYKKAWGAIKDTWKGLASKLGFNKADTSKIDDMTSGEAAEYILTQMAQGKKFGDVSPEKSIDKGDVSSESRKSKDGTNGGTITLPSGRKIPAAQKYLHTDTKGNLHDEMWSVFLEKHTGDGAVSQEFSDVVEGLFSGRDFDADAIKALPEWKRAMEREQEIQRDLQETHGVSSTIDINTEDREQFREAIIKAAMSDHISKTVPIEGTDREFETNEGLGNGESYDVEKGRNICIVIGLPAAGKSTSFANPLAKKFKARLCDSDTIKKVLPEFNNGYGGNLVHEESTKLNEEILGRSIEQGDNIVYPILGYKPETLEKLFERLRDKGYKINLCLKDMPANVAKGRLLGRFLSKGRYLPIECITKAQGKFADCFERVKGLVDAYVRATSDIDGSNERIIEQKGDLI